MQSNHRRKAAVLCGLIIVAMVYVGLLLRLPTLTGDPFVDGVVGIAIGLYVCSHPAATAVDLLFFRRYAVQRVPSGWLGLGWLALNLLALLMGWLVLTMGAARLTSPGAIPGPRV